MVFLATGRFQSNGYQLDSTDRLRYGGVMTFDRLTTLIRNSESREEAAVRIVAESDMTVSQAMDLLAMPYAVVEAKLDGRGRARG